MKVVFWPEMVPEGTDPPSPEHADGMLGFYLTARLAGEDNEEYRKFLRGAWALACIPDRTGPASAVAAAQSALSFGEAEVAVVAPGHPWEAVAEADSLVLVHLAWPPEPGSVTT